MCAASCHLRRRQRSKVGEVGEVMDADDVVELLRPLPAEVPTDPSRDAMELLRPLRLRPLFRLCSSGERGYKGGGVVRLCHHARRPLPRPPPFLDGVASARRRWSTCSPRGVGQHRSDLPLPATDPLEERVRRQPASRISSRRLAPPPGSRETKGDGWGRRAGTGARRRAVGHVRDEERR
jgi:hypothetical protein